MNVSAKMFETHYKFIGVQDIRSLTLTGGAIWAQGHAART